MRDPLSQDVYYKLFGFAVFDMVLSASPSRHLLARARERNEPIPEQCKPGWLLQQLTEDERKALSGLTSDMTRNERHWSK